MSFPQDERSQLPGWPGYRTRPGRSGLDWIDNRIEAQHMMGVFVRGVLDNKLRTQNPAGLILMAFGSVIGLLPGIIMTIELFLVGRFNVVLWIAVSLYALVGSRLFINLITNINLLMSSKPFITNLHPDNIEDTEQAASLLVEGFREHWPEAWPDLDSALKEVREMLAEDRICRVALDREGNVVGWIGGIPEYDGHVWELHPLVVKPDEQQQGIGRALVTDFEEQVRQRGGLTVRLGTDDEDNMTTLSNVDLYKNTWGQIADIRNLKGHPYEFYQKLGYTITGVVPDANGPGKPDILMAKRVHR